MTAGDLPRCETAAQLNLLRDAMTRFSNLHLTELINNELPDCTLPCTVTEYSFEDLKVTRDKCSLEDCKVGRMP